MKGSAELLVFQSALRHLSQARRCATVVKTGDIPAIRSVAVTDLQRATKALFEDLAILDDMGTLERLKAILAAEDPSSKSP